MSETADMVAGGKTRPPVSEGVKASNREIPERVENSVVSSRPLGGARDVIENRMPLLNNE